MSPTIRTGDSRRLSAPLHSLERARLDACVPRRLYQVSASSDGRQTRPLLYTGLRGAPARLSWRNPPWAETYQMRAATMERSSERVSTRAAFDWPDDLCARPGERVWWSIAPLDRHGTPGAGVEGVFWVLEPQALANLRAAEGAIARIPDLEILTIARALTFARHELYDEAVDVLSALPGLVPLRGGGVLAHRAFVTILTEMEAKMPADASPSARAWVQARLALHREALIHCLPAAHRPNADSVPRRPAVLERQAAYRVA